MLDEIEFDKYHVRGAYHWAQVEGSIRERNAFVSARYQAVVDVLQPLHGQKVLDIGGGDGVLSYQLAKAGAKPVITDVIPIALHMAQQAFAERGSTVNVSGASAYELPFPDNSFDIAVCADVIEHVQLPEKLLSEAKRVLVPGGRCVITTPLRFTEIPLDKAHVREFYSSELEALVSTYFQNIQVTTFASVALIELIRYPIAPLGRRPLFRYLFNALEKYFGFNVFTLNQGFNYFSMLRVVGHKEC